MAEVALSSKAPGAPSRVHELVRRKTPWKESEEIEVAGPSGEVVLCQRPVAVHVPSHGCCVALYVLSLASFAVHSLLTWATEKPATTFSTEPSSQFPPVLVNVAVDCQACTTHANKQRKWVVTYGYQGFAHCAGAGDGAMTDVMNQSVVMCRATDDISDASGVRVRLDNISEGLRAISGRPMVNISVGEFAVTTPLESWHEKTLLLGIVARRDAEECTTPSDCNLDVELYLASMQYDGHVTWGGDGWGGAQLNIRVLRFAQVYTTLRRPLLDVLAGIGGASAMLMGVFGAFRKVIEVLMVFPRDMRAVHDAAAHTVKQVAEQGVPL
mmetsp:Transcript_27609/g.91692  ORF Transcript_27609/g.91692 Transcript_27609/m.91692 type:complete len:326 (+) Transcript_27609:73-1050(+)